MQLKKLTIENFRGFDKVELDLDETTVLIGENNTGKTSILEAIHLCLGGRSYQRRLTFKNYDYHLPNKDALPGRTGTIILTFRFFETNPDEWAEDIIQALNEVVVFKGELQAITLRITSKYDENTKDFVTNWEFLDANDKPLPKIRPQILSTLQQFCPVFYLEATRDAVKDFSPRSPFWSPFLRNPDIDQEVRDELEHELISLNNKIVEAHRSLKIVVDNLKKTGSVVPRDLEQLVTIEALPGRAFDALSRAQVSITGVTGAYLPLTCHGAGTQSLSTMFLFEAFLTEMLKKTFDTHSNPILTLEEPEAHLHPSAVRTLWKLLQEMKGQKIIATHSGDLLAEVPLSSIRRLCLKNRKIVVNKIRDDLSEDDLRKIKFHVRYARGELFFARCWVLVEGETEFQILSGIADLMGDEYDLERYSVRIITTRNLSLKSLLKIANDLGIAWHCLTDNDSQGQSDADKARDALNNRPESDHLTILTQDYIELFLCMNGYREVYKNHISPQKIQTINTQESDGCNYWKQVIKAKDNTPKPAIAIEVMELMSEQSINLVPELLKSVIKTSVSLAKRQ